MSAQRLAFGLPFSAYVNETGTAQRLFSDGAVFVDETGTVAITAASVVPTFVQSATVAVIDKLTSAKKRFPASRRSVQRR